MTHKKSMIFALIFAVAGSTVFGGSTAVRSMEEPVSSMDDAQTQRVEERKADIRQRIEAKKAERAEKLADKRLEQCKKRQGKINAIFEKATQRNEKHLAVFQKIEENVKAFYVNKNITAEGYDAAVANADDKEAAAIAAIEASNEVTFDCATTDAAKPGSAIKEAMAARHEALKAYRTAIKDLILVVKQHNGQNRSGAGDTTRENDTETENESTRPEEQ